MSTQPLHSGNPLYRLQESADAGYLWRPVCSEPIGGCLMASASGSFATLLKCFRLAAGLSQEALAEQAAIFPSAVSALERGVNRKSYLETARLLADALALSFELRRELQDQLGISSALTNLGLVAGF